MTQQTFCFQRRVEHAAGYGWTGGVLWSHGPFCVDYNWPFWKPFQFGFAPYVGSFAKASDFPGLGKAKK